MSRKVTIVWDEDDIKLGDKISFVIEGEVKEIFNTGHGISYLIEAPQKDFSDPREIYLDIDDLKGCIRHKRKKKSKEG